MSLEVTRNEKSSADEVALLLQNLPATLPTDPTERTALIYEQLGQRQIKADEVVTEIDRQLAEAEQEKSTVAEDAATQRTSVVESVTTGVRSAAEQARSYVQSASTEKRIQFLQQVRESAMTFGQGMVQDARNLTGAAAETYQKAPDAVKAGLIVGGIITGWMALKHAFKKPGKAFLSFLGLIGLGGTALAIKQYFSPTEADKTTHISKKKKEEAAQPPKKEEEQPPKKEEAAQPPKKEEEQPPKKEEAAQPPKKEEEQPPKKEEAAQPPKKEEEQPPKKEEEQPPKKEEAAQPPKKEEEQPPKKEEAAQPPKKEEEQPPKKEEEQPPKKEEAAQPPKKEEEQPPKKEEEQPPKKEEAAQSPKPTPELSSIPPMDLLGSGPIDFVFEGRKYSLSVDGRNGIIAINNKRWQLTGRDSKSWLSIQNPVTYDYRLEQAQWTGNQINLSVVPHYKKGGARQSAGVTPNYLTTKEIRELLSHVGSSPRNPYKVETTDEKSGKRTYTYVDLVNLDA